MKQGSTLILRGAVAAITLAVLALCVFALPAGIQTDEAAAFRPIFYGMYVTVIPFLIAVCQTFTLLNYIDTNKAFSEKSVAALHVIKWCAAVIGLLYAISLPFLYRLADVGDAPGVLAIGLALTGAPLTIAVFAAVLQKLLKNAIDIKCENDLTV